MSNASDILSYALNDRFHQVSNPINIGRDFAKTLYQMVRAANRVFEKDKDIGVSSLKHLIMDVNEAGASPHLRPNIHKSCVLLMNIHDTSKSDLRKHFVPLPEPGLVLRFKANGKVECATTGSVLSDTQKNKPEIIRKETLRVDDQAGIQKFVASWLRVNLDAETMVAIQKTYLKQEQKDCDALWVWSPQQRDRLNALKYDT